MSILEIKSSQMRRNIFLKKEKSTIASILKLSRELPISGTLKKIANRDNQNKNKTKKITTQIKTCWPQHGTEPTN